MAMKCGTPPPFPHVTCALESLSKNCDEEKSASFCDSASSSIEKCFTNYVLKYKPLSKLSHKLRDYEVNIGKEDIPITLGLILLLSMQVID